MDLSHFVCVVFCLVLDGYREIPAPVLQIYFLLSCLLHPAVNLPIFWSAALHSLRGVRLPRGCRGCSTACAWVSHKQLLPAKAVLVSFVSQGCLAPAQLCLLGCGSELLETGPAMAWNSRALVFLEGVVCLGEVWTSGCGWEWCWRKGACFQEMCGAISLWYDFEPPPAANPQPQSSPGDAPCVQLLHEDKISN